MEKKKKIILIIIGVIIVGSLSFYFWQNYQKQKANRDNPQKQIVYDPSIEEKIKFALDPKTCGQFEQINKVGYVSERGMDFIRVESGRNTPSQVIKINNDTLFIETMVDTKGKELSKRLISFLDVDKMQNVSVFAFKQGAEKDIVARIIKVIK